MLVMIHTIRMSINDSTIYMYTAYAQSVVMTKTQKEHLNKQGIAIFEFMTMNLT